MYQQNKHDKDPIQILATLDQNYLPRLKVLLTSIRINQPEISSLPLPIPGKQNSPTISINFGWGQTVII